MRQGEKYLLNPKATSSLFLTYIDTTQDMRSDCTSEGWKGFLLHSVKGFLGMYLSAVARGDATKLGFLLSPDSLF